MIFNSYVIVNCTKETSSPVPLFSIKERQKRRRGGARLVFKIPTDFFSCLLTNSIHSFLAPLKSILASYIKTVTDTCDLLIYNQYDSVNLSGESFYTEYIFYTFYTKILDRLNMNAYISNESQWYGRRNHCLGIYPNQISFL